MAVSILESRQGRKCKYYAWLISDSDEVQSLCDFCPRAQSRGLNACCDFVRNLKDTSAAFACPANIVQIVTNIHLFLGQSCNPN